MGTTTFSGPIKAGTISTTTGQRRKDIKNTGQVVMAHMILYRAASNSHCLRIT
jgi:hypothetical protein